jgi:aldose 1-epimerase
MRQRRRIAVHCLSVVGLGAAMVWLGGCGSPDDGDPEAPAASASSEQPGHDEDASVDDPSTQTPPQQSEPSLTIREEAFGTLLGEDGKPHRVTRYTLDNGRMSVAVLNYGAVVQSVRVPDKSGKPENVTLGFADLDGYSDMEQKDPYFGAVAGRYGNRIAGGKFELNGKTYQLAKNNGPNHLHGGNRGFNDVLWQARPLPDDLTELDAVGVELTYISGDGEEGYPGELKSVVRYLLTEDDTLRMEYDAQLIGDGELSTPINLTNHCYWNLGGVDDEEPKSSKSILDHVLMLNCDRYLPVDETLIPTGEMKPVAGTPFDFTKPKPIGKDFAAVKGDAAQGGYDHCFVVTDWNAARPEPKLIARVSDPDSGRVMEIETDQPGVQFYTGNFLSGGEPDGGFPQHHGFCLETQKLPDSPNQKTFPSAILRPGEVYRHITIHRFHTEGGAAGG